MIAPSPRASLQKRLAGAEVGAPAARFPEQVRAILYLLSANLLKIALGFITSAILFRSLGPGDMGRMTTALGVIGLLSIIGEFGLRDAVVKRMAYSLSACPEQATPLARTFFICRLSLSALASAVALLGANWLAAHLIPEAQAAALIRLAAASLFADGLLAFSMVILEAHQDFAALGAVNAAQTILRFVLILGLFFLASVNLTTLLLLETVLPLLTFCYSLRSIPRSYLAVRRPLVPYLGPLFHFSKWIGLAALASLAIAKLDVLMLGAYRPPVDVGLYAAALVLAGKLDLVKGPILTTLFPEACRQPEAQALLGYVRRSLSLTVPVSLALLPLVGLGRLLIALLYGAAYQDAAPAFALLLVAFLIDLNAEPVGFVLYAADRPRWIAWKELVLLALFVSFGLVLIPRYGLMGAAETVLLQRLCGTLFTWLLMRKAIAGENLSRGPR